MVDTYVPERIPNEKRQCPVCEVPPGAAHIPDVTSRGAIISGRKSAGRNLWRPVRQCAVSGSVVMRVERKSVSAVGMLSEPTSATGVALKPLPDPSRIGGLAGLTLRAVRQGLPRRRSWGCHVGGTTRSRNWPAVSVS